jgi:hypothetical protein
MNQKQNEPIFCFAINVITTLRLQQPFVGQEQRERQTHRNILRAREPLGYYARILHIPRIRSGNIASTSLMLIISRWYRFTDRSIEYARKLKQTGTVFFGATGLNILFVC